MIDILLLLLGIAFLALCLFLVVIILLQPGKSSGGGAAGLGATSSIGAAGAIAESLGATQAEKTLSRWTSAGIGVFFVMALALTLLLTAREQQHRLNLAPAAPTNAPAAAGPQATDPENAGLPGEVSLPEPAPAQVPDANVTPAPAEPAP